MLTKADDDAHAALTPAEALDVLETPGFTPWHGLCPPNSTARRTASGKPIDAVPPGPSFVSLEHEAAMDLCLHPEIQSQNGFTSW